ncbi:hypothetical protein PV703_04140 [Streptomyces sp. ME01-24h]|nr:hypothetical protein [Streptomyces sp. ME19-03-3]MDX3352526.1 hypothetical protein [Streptomyces sp. ME01-24h]
MTNRSSECVRCHCGVPARRGLEIACWDPAKEPREAVIVGFQNQYRRVRLDGDKHISTLHLTWGHLVGHPRSSLPQMV